TQRAGFESSRIVALDAPVDPAHVPTLAVSGRLRGEGVGLAGPVTLRFLARDADGSTVRTTTSQVHPDPVTGAYAVERVFLLDAASVEVVAEVGHPADGFYRTVVELDGAGRHEVTFDVDHTPARFELVGRVPAGSQPFALRIDALIAGVAWPQTTVTVTPGPDGAYSVPVELRRGATGARFTANLGDFPAD